MRLGDKVRYVGHNRGHPLADLFSQPGDGLGHFNDSIQIVGRLTRQPGVCAVSSGVAHVNALTGVLNGWFDGAPMLLLTGAGALRTTGMGHFQDCDQVAMASPITRFAKVIDHPERAVHMLDEALDVALAPGPGPVHLTFPLDIQTTEVAERDLVASPPRLAPLAESDVDAVASALAAAHRPLVVAGNGLYYAGEGDAMLRFCEENAVPVVAPIWDRGTINRPSPAFLGVLGAASGGPRLLDDADCIVMAGAAPDYRVGFLDTNATVVSLTRGWDRIGEAYQHAGGTPHSDWLAEGRRRHTEFRSRVEAIGARQAEEGTHAVHIMSALRQVLRDDTALLIDGGSTGQWAHQLLCDRYPGHWLTCGRSGVVGWGIGGAMAARLAFPDRSVILLSGDGAFTFNVADLERAVHHALPFVAIVADDQGWGISRTGHLKNFGEPIASSLGPIALDRLAESLGARGIRAAGPEEIAPALERALATPAVTVIHVPVVGGFPAEA
ncbi:MAG: thiamine pyrophosphate-binding protein [bacterium]|nr:thiamine pyrophosphate-binding protein [bacterium]